MDTTLNHRLAAVFRDRGHDPKQLPTALQKAFFFRYTVELDTIAAGGSATGQFTSDGGSVFVVQQLQATATLKAALSSAVVNSPIPRRPSPGSDSNEMPNLTMIDVSFSMNNVVWQDKAGTLAAISGDGFEPYYLPTQAIIDPMATLTADLTNNAAVALGVEITFVGQRIPLG